MNWILAEGRNANGDAIAHLYRINGPLFKADGNGAITLDVVSAIQEIACHGRTPTMSLPDTGKASSLLGLSLVALLVRIRYRVR